MWEDSIRNIVVIFQTNILRIVGFYVRRSATVWHYQNLFFGQYKKKPQTLQVQCYCTGLNNPRLILVKKSIVFYATFKKFATSTVIVLSTS